METLQGNIMIPPSSKDVRPDLGARVSPRAGAHVPTVVEGLGTAGLAQIWVNENGVLCEWDDWLHQMLGYQDADLRGRPAADLVPAMGGSPVIVDGEVQPRLMLFCRFGVVLRARHESGTDIPCRLQFQGLTITPEPRACFTLQMHGPALPRVR